MGERVTRRSARIRGQVAVNYNEDEYDTHTHKVTFTRVAVAPAPAEVAEGKRRKIQIQELTEPNQNNTEEVNVLNGLSFQVFDIHLLWNTITDNLDVADLKAMSQVDHYFFNRVKKHKGFQNMSLFPITIKNIPPVSRTLHSRFDLIWKNVQIDITKAARASELETITSTLKKRLKRTKSLYIYSKDKTFDYNEIDLKVQTIKRILSSAPKLESLTVSCRLFKLDWTKEILQDQTIISRFKELKELHFITESDYFSGGNSISLTNLKHLNEIPMKLDAFSWKQNHDTDELFLTPVFDFIRKNQNSLKSLSLDGGILETEGLQNIRCPALTKLKVMNTDTVPIEFPGLYAFINNLDNLQDLEIVLDRLDLELLEILETKSKQWKLKRFRLDCDHFDPLIPANWNFLSILTLDNINDFEIRIEHPKFGYRQLLTDLPSNLKSLNIRGLKDPAITDSEFMRNELQRFTSLTELSLLGSSGKTRTPITIMDEHLLKYIFGNMTQLKILRLSNFPRVKGYETTRRDGIDLGENISILNLKNLKKLMIVNCPGIIEYFAFTSNISFPELTFLMLVLDYDAWMGISGQTWQWETIVRQNQRLHTIVLTSSKNKNLGSELKALSPNLRHIFNVFEDVDRFSNRISTARYYEDNYTDYAGYEI